MSSHTSSPSSLTPQPRGGGIGLDGVEGLDDDLGGVLALVRLARLRGGEDAPRSNAGRTTRDARSRRRRERAWKGCRATRAAGRVRGRAAVVETAAGATRVAVAACILRVGSGGEGEEPTAARVARVRATRVQRKKRLRRGRFRTRRGGARWRRAGVLSLPRASHCAHGRRSDGDSRAATACGIPSTAQPIRRRHSGENHRKSSLLQVDRGRRPIDAKLETEKGEFTGDRRGDLCGRVKTSVSDVVSNVVDR